MQRCVCVCARMLTAVLFVIVENWKRKYPSGGDWHIHTMQSCAEWGKSGFTDMEGNVQDITSLKGELWEFFYFSLSFCTVSIFHEHVLLLSLGKGIHGNLSVPDLLKIVKNRWNEDRKACRPLPHTLLLSQSPGSSPLSTLKAPPRHQHSPSPHPWGFGSLE